MTLLETIKIIDGQVQHLPFHQTRFDYSRKILFNNQKPISLTAIIQPPESTGILRCRVLYGTEIEQIEYLPYQPRSFKRFQLVYDDQIAYPFKYAQREQLNRLFQLKQQADEIIIIKQGVVTDCSIANLAFYKNNQWITPNTPLLAGTTRQRLLKQGIISEQTIKVTDLSNFSKMAMMNALLDFYVIESFELYE